MQTAPHRWMLISLALAAPSHAAPADGALLGPGVLVGAAWLLLGLAFYVLLRTHLRQRDQLADAQAQLDIERRARALSERALGDTHCVLSRLVQERDCACETERTRIARDIHDDLGQNLLALKMELCALRAGSGATPPQLGERLCAMAGNLELTIKSLRVVVNNLRPLALDAGLRSAIEWQLGEFSRINGISYQFDADPDAFGPGSDKAVDAMLFRILQESLSNVVRHACATEVRIALRRRAGQLTFEVQDNGVGMSAQARQGGCGLPGIRDRVSALGGQFHVDSVAGAGTVLSLTIPVPADVAAH